VHVVWYDETDGEWGTDTEIMYAKRTAAGWSNVTIISDDSTGWNDGSSEFPDIAIDGNGNLHVVWSDDTDGEWGTDKEIMYSSKSIETPDNNQVNLIIIPISDSSIAILSPIGLGIIGIAMVITAIISVGISKKKS